MSLATFTRKGSLTIPVDVRKALGLRPHDTVHFTVLPDGTVLMRAKSAHSRIWRACLMRLPIEAYRSTSRQAGFLVRTESVEKRNEVSLKC